ncbi:hypothetical protein GQ42DRAFT_153310 [Ramicandelaber brevisporus]|nr:hypothetical protein GQ42DRAFT_153310 [Ramicandelaber brevisporus]
MYKLTLTIATIAAALVALSPPVAAARQRCMHSVITCTFQTEPGDASKVKDGGKCAVKLNMKNEFNVEATVDNVPYHVSDPNGTEMHYHWPGQTQIKWMAGNDGKISKVQVHDGCDWKELPGESSAATTVTPSAVAAMLAAPTPTGDKFRFNLYNNYYPTAAPAPAPSSAPPASAAGSASQAPPPSSGAAPAPGPSASTSAAASESVSVSVSASGSESVSVSVSTSAAASASSSAAASSSSSSQPQPSHPPPVIETKFDHEMCYESNC